MVLRRGSGYPGGAQGGDAKMRLGPSRRRAPPQHLLPRGPTSQAPLTLGLEKLLPPACSTRTSPGSRRQPLSHLLPQDRREPHLYGLTATGAAPKGPLVWPPSPHAPLGI